MIHPHTIATNCYPTQLSRIFFSPVVGDWFLIIRNVAWPSLNNHCVYWDRLSLYCLLIFTAQPKHRTGKRKKWKENICIRYRINPLPTVFGNLDSYQLMFICLLFVCLGKYIECNFWNSHLINDQLSVRSILLIVG